MIVQSPYQDITFPEVSQPEFILEKVRSRGEKPAFIDGMTGERLSYVDLANRIDRTAAGLSERGFGKGDVVCIFSPNRIEWPIAYFAALKLGGIVTTANPLYTASELNHQLIDANARFLITDPLFVEISIVAAKGTRVEEIFVFGETEGATPFTDLESNNDPPEVDISGDDVAVLPYSSGTTGLPKGVMLTHRNLVCNTSQTIVAEPFREEDVLVGILPLYHIYGMMIFLHLSIYQGACVVTMPRFDMEHFLRILQDYKVTRAYLVPPIVLGLAHHPIVDNYDLSHLQVVLSAAAPIGVATAQTASKRLNVPVKQAYGMTELSPVTHLMPDNVSNVGSVGPAIPNTECMIVDIDTLAPLGANEEGELWVRGPQVMKGYLNQPQATAETITDDGWLRTGDIGRIDQDGFLYITDRLKELIKYNAYQVAPAELEGILTAHPKIADAAVIGSPSDEHGEVPKAYCVLADEISQEEIMAYVAEQVSPQKRIRMVEFVDVIPKAASGKILRRVLRDQERERVATANE